MKNNRQKTTTFIEQNYTLMLLMPKICLSPSYKEVDKIDR